MQPRKRIKIEPGTEVQKPRFEDHGPVPDQNPGEYILIEDDEDNKDGKQHHYQAFMRRLVIFVNLKF